MRLVALRLVALRLVALRLGALRLVALRLVALRLVALRLVALRFGALRLVALRLVAFLALRLAAMKTPPGNNEAIHPDWMDLTLRGGPRRRPLLRARTHEWKPQPADGGFAVSSKRRSVDSLSAIFVVGGKKEGKRNSAVEEKSRHRPKTEAPSPPVFSIVASKPLHTIKFPVGA